MFEELVKIFVEEAEENLSVIEKIIISLEDHPGDEDLVNTVFRAIHSIKGGAGLAGFDKVQFFSHKAEDLFEAIRNGSLNIDSDLISVILEAIDKIKMMVSNIARGDESDQDLETEEILEKIEHFIHRSIDERVLDSQIENDPDAWKHYFIDLHYKPDIFREGIDPLIFIDDLRDMGEILFLKLDTSLFPPAEEFNPQQFYLGWQLFFRTKESRAVLDNIFCFVLEDNPIDIINLDSILEFPEELEAYSIDGRSIKNYLYRESKELTPRGEETGDPLSENTTGEDRRSLDRRKGDRRRGGRRSSDFSSGSYIRVPTDRLENIFNIVSELMISQARLAMLNNAHSGNVPNEYQAVGDSLSGIVEQLQDQVTSLRMVSLNNSFEAFKRLVRDISTELGKKIRLHISGQDTELDKNMIEKLNDPLKHLVRNCIDHGIETLEERNAAGKSPEGNLSLSASLEEGKVVIEVSDDGKGIDTDFIFQKAAEKGIISADVPLSHDEIINLIFHPGFSTAKEVTDLSGRGVGMDVVKSSITNLNGSVGITSRKGTGTSFKLYLPLTLAILDGIVASVGQEKYIIPALSVLEIFRSEKDHVKSVVGKGELVLFRDDFIPMIRLNRVFQVENSIEEAKNAEIIVVRSGELKAGLMVDRVVEQQQVVLKSIEKNFKKINYFTSATIMGDGNVALIIDLQSLLSEF